MTFRKEHLEFQQIDMETGWHTPTGYPREIEQKILAGALYEITRTGARTRLLRFRPGAQTERPFVHDYWEEVYLLTGDLIVGDQKSGAALQTFAPNTYACRPPGVYHGPFRSDHGCLLLEFHYYG